jgi:hypothetical protein
MAKESKSKKDSGKQAPPKKVVKKAAKKRAVTGVRGTGERKAASPSSGAKKPTKAGSPFGLSAAQHEKAGVSYIAKIFRKSTSDEQLLAACTAVCFTENKNIGSFADAGSAWEFIKNVHLKQPGCGNHDCDVICKNPRPTT